MSDVSKLASKRSYYSENSHKILAEKTPKLKIVDSLDTRFLVWPGFFTVVCFSVVVHGSAAYC